MKSSLLNRILLAMLMILSITILVLFGLAFISSLREKQQLTKRYEELELELIEKKKELQFSKEYIDQMMNNPEFFEHVAREKLGYVKPNEKIIRIEQEEPSRVEEK